MLGGGDFYASSVYLSKLRRQAIHLARQLTG